MKKTVMSCDRKQMLSLPTSFPDRPQQEHLSHFIPATLEQLDLPAAYSSHGGNGRGQPPPDPEMKLSILFHAHCIDVVSSRKIENRSHGDVAFLMIAADTLLQTL